MPNQDNLIHKNQNCSGAHKNKTDFKELLSTEVHWVNVCFLSKLSTSNDFNFIFL